MFNNDFQQHEKQVRDENNNRYVQCVYCGRIVSVTDCWTYGGNESVNVGKCYECLVNRVLERTV